MSAETSRDTSNGMVQHLSVQRFALLMMMLGSATAASAQSQPASSEDLQFRQWLVGYLAKEPDDVDLHNLVYGYALIDLNGDRRNEALVWSRDRFRCGTGGCNLDIFVRANSGWRLFSSTPITRPPIKILPSSTQGWRDLASWQAGGGIQRPYQARLQFNGTDYEIVWPEDWTGLEPPPDVGGRTLISDATIALFPDKCRRVDEGPSVFGPITLPSGQPLAQTLGSRT